MSMQDRIVEKASRVVPLGITSYRRDWGALCDAATLLGVPRDPLSQAAHEALTKAGMRGKRFRAWVAGGGAATLLGDITDPVAFNAVVRDAPPQIRADVADALAEAYTAAVASDKAALRKASMTPSLPRKRKVTTPPRLDPCVPKGGARTWGRPKTPFKSATASRRAGAGGGSPASSRRLLIAGTRSPGPARRPATKSRRPTSVTTNNLGL
jgi:hypothetical protein